MRGTPLQHSRPLAPTELRAERARRGLPWYGDASAAARLAPPRELPPGEWLTTSQVAQAAGCSRHTLLKARADGQLTSRKGGPTRTGVGGAHWGWEYERKSAEAWMAARRRG